MQLLLLVVVQGCSHLKLFASRIKKKVLEVLDKLLPESKLLAYQIKLRYDLAHYTEDKYYLINKTLDHF